VVHRLVLVVILAVDTVPSGCDKGHMGEERFAANSLEDPDIGLIDCCEPYVLNTVKIDDAVDGVLP